MLLGSAYGKVLIDVSTTMDNLGKVGDGLRTLEGKLAGAGDQIKRVGDKMKQAGDTLTRDVTLPIVAVGVASGKMAMDFESSMSQIEGLVGKSQEQVKAWSSQILELGPKVGKSPVELSKALYFITSAGIDDAKAMDVLTTSAKAASAGLGETQIVADAVTSALNAYAGSNLDAGTATGILVAAVREGKGEANEIAPALGRVIPIAAQLGISFDQVSAALAAQTLVGFDAAEAATNLSGIMSALLKPSKQASDTLSAFGLSAAGLREQIKEQGLLAVLNTLRESIGGDDEALAAIFPNIRGFRGLLSLTGENADKTNAIFQKLAGAGVADLNKAFDAASKTSKFQFQAAMAQVQDLLITLGSSVLPAVMPVLKQLAEAIKNVADWFKNLNPETQRTIVILAGIAAAIGPVLSIGGRLISMLGLILKGVSALGLSLGPGSLLIAGLIAIVGFLNAVGQAARATNDDLVKMAHSGDLFSQAGATFEIATNGTNRLRQAVKDHEVAMRSSASTYGEYQTEVRRAAGVIGLQVDAEGNLIKVTQGMGYQLKETVQANYALTEAQYNLSKAQQNNAGILDESDRALARHIDAMNAAATAQEDLTTKVAESWGVVTNARSLAIGYTDKENALAEKLKELADVEAKIAAQGPVRTATVAAQTSATQDQTAANDTNNASLSESLIFQDKLAAAQSAASETTRRAGESTFQMADRLKKAQDALKGLNEQTGAHLIATDAANGADLKATIQQEKLAVAIEKLDTIKRKKNETEAEFALRVDQAQLKVHELTATTETHTAAVGGATKAQLEHKAALEKEIAEMQRTAEIDRAKDAFDRLTKALQAGAIDVNEYNIRASALNNITHLYSQSALTAAIQQEQLVAALTDPAAANWAEVLDKNRAALDGVAASTETVGKKVIRVSKQDLLDLGVSLGEVSGKAKTKASEAIDASTRSASAAHTAITGVMNKARDSITDAADTATRKTNQIKDALDKLPKQIDIRINISASALPTLPTGGGGTPAAGHKQHGGAVMEGLYHLHDDEFVLSKAMREGRQAIPAEAFRAAEPTLPAGGVAGAVVGGLSSRSITIAPTINVTAAPGMSEARLAEIIAQRLGKMANEAQRNGMGWMGI